MSTVCLVQTVAILRRLSRPREKPKPTKVLKLRTFSDKSFFIFRHFFRIRNQIDELRPAIAGKKEGVNPCWAHE